MERYEVRREIEKSVGTERDEEMQKTVSTLVPRYVRKTLIYNISPPKNWHNYI